MCIVPLEAEKRENRTEEISPKFTGRQKLHVSKSLPNFKDDNNKKPHFPLYCQIAEKQKGKENL